MSEDKEKTGINEEELKDGTETVSEETQNAPNEDKQPEESASEKETSVEEQLRAQIDDLNDKLLRRLAEFDNFRKRTAAEKAAMYSSGIGDAAEKLLGVMDNFERALSSESDKESSFYKGVEMIYNQMKSAFESMGVREIEAEGETFDPNVHNAVMHTENEELGENVVAKVLQKGYKINDRVIRPAMVVVAN